MKWAENIISIFFIDARLWDLSILRDLSTRLSKVITSVLDEEDRQLSVGRADGRKSAGYMTAVGGCTRLPCSSCIASIMWKKETLTDNFTQHRTSVKTSTMNNDVRGLPSTAGVEKLRSEKILKCYY